MTIEIITGIEQNTPQWLELRRGLITASEIDLLVINGKTKGSPSVRRLPYIRRLAAERAGAELAQSYSNGHMERGHMMQDDARALYTFVTDEETELVSFILRDDPRGGCSPDALIANRRGGLEIKSKLPHLQVELLLADEVPAEHIPQLHGQMLFGELDFVDFMSFWPGLPPFLKRVKRDETYITNLRGEVDRANFEIAEIVARIRAYGEPMPIEPNGSTSLLMCG